MARARRKPSLIEKHFEPATMRIASIKAKGVDLGQLQSDFASARSHLKSAETALLHAQEAKDRAVATFDTARRALLDGTRAALG